VDDHSWKTASACRQVHSTRFFSLGHRMRKDFQQSSIERPSAEGCSGIRSNDVVFSDAIVALFPACPSIHRLIRRSEERKRDELGTTRLQRTSIDAIRACIIDPVPADEQVAIKRPPLRPNTMFVRDRVKSRKAVQRSCRRRLRVSRGEDHPRPIFANIDYGSSFWD